MQQLKPLRQTIYLLIVVIGLLVQTGFTQDNVQNVQNAQRELTVHSVPIQSTTTIEVVPPDITDTELITPDTTIYIGQDNVARTLRTYPNNPAINNPAESSGQNTLKQGVIQETSIEKDNSFQADSGLQTTERTLDSETNQQEAQVLIGAIGVTEVTIEELPFLTDFMQTEVVETELQSEELEAVELQAAETVQDEAVQTRVVVNTGERQLTVHGSSAQSDYSVSSVTAIPISAPAEVVPPEELAPEELPNVGRLMMVAFEQSDTQTQTIMREIQPGGFAFFPGDIVSTLQIQTLTDSLQENADHPLIFAIDQEGGPFTSYRIEDATLFPGAMMLAATNDTELAKRVGEATAKELNYAGLTMNFAPVADVNSNPDNPIIGIRSFGDDPEKVSAFTQAFAEGSVASGVASVTKHFPGHGNTTMDSHLELPRIESSLEVMRATDLEPFKNNLDSPAIMTAHIVFPALDEVWPATLSHTILTDLLRTEMGYEGLVITDSLVMGALTNSYTSGTIAVKAINAGADMLLVGASFYEQQIIHDALTDALETGEIPLWRVEEALARIDNLATTYPPTIDVDVPDYESHRDLAIEVAQKGTTLVSNGSQAVPIDSALSVSVIAPRPRGFGTPPHLGSVLSEFMPNIKKAEVSVNPNWSQINTAVAVSQDADVIVLGVYYWLGEFPSRMKELYNSLKNLGKPVIVVSLGNPNVEVHLGLEPDAHIAVYGYRYSNLYGAAAVLSGEIEAVGILPIGQTQ